MCAEIYEIHEIYEDSCKSMQNHKNPSMSMKIMKSVDVYENLPKSIEIYRNHENLWKSMKMHEIQ